MQELYLLDKKDIKRIRKMVDLLEKALIEIIQMKQLKTGASHPDGPAQSDLIEAEDFARLQLELFDSRTCD